MIPQAPAEHKTAVIVIELMSDLVHPSASSINTQVINRLFTSAAVWFFSAC